MYSAGKKCYLQDKKTFERGHSGPKMKVTYGEKGVPSLELVIHLWRPPMGKKCSTHELEW